MTTTELDKQTAILNTTLDLIAEHGFHGTPMSMIAKRSGVSAGIIYHYFENKDDLIHQLYRRIKSRLSEALIEGDPHKQPWPVYLKQVWLNAYHFYANHPKETVFLEQYENSPFLGEAHSLTFDDNITRLVEVIQRDIDRELVRDMPYEVIYALTLGVAISLAKRQINGTLHLDDAILAETAAACCRAIEA